MKMWSSKLWLRFKQSQIKPEECFRGFNRIRTRGLCVSAAVLHQLVYEDPYVDKVESWLIINQYLYVRSSHNTDMFHFFQGYDELNKLACSKRMGLHSSQHFTELWNWVTQDCCWLDIGRAYLFWHLFPRLLESKDGTAHKGRTNF